MPKPTEDLSKLPKWAQHRIAALTDHVEHLEKIVAQGPVDSNTFTYNFDITPSRPLGRNTKVRFRLDDLAASELGERIDVQVRETKDGHALDIGSDEPLIIEPRSSNRIWIRLS